MVTGLSSADRVQEMVKGLEDRGGGVPATHTHEMCELMYPRVCSEEHYQYWG